MQDYKARLMESRATQQARRHAPQISISDTNHHVTEAIGGMYGSEDDEYPSPNGKRREPRPLSFIPGASPKALYEQPNQSYFDTKRSSPPRQPLARTTSNERTGSISPKMAMRKGSMGGNENEHRTINGPKSPPLLARTNSAETAVQQFPLNDIDYESSPAAVAQELSNLQAIRRMSMNVDNADPDLPSFASAFGLPSPPSPNADDDDAARLFWVPARLHPELAPVEFKTFLDDRVDKMRRLSDGEDSRSPEGLERHVSAGLKRKKSMLSRTIDTGKGYEDGAERLERKRSEGRNHQPLPATENLSELETLVNDPTTLMRKLSLDTARRSEDSGVDLTDDMPILPASSLGLKRSTRTAYRRGSLRKGERTPFSKRAMTRNGDTDTEDSLAPSPIKTEEPVMGLTRVQTEPIPAPAPPEPAENFSRPSRKYKPGMGMSASTENLLAQSRKSPSLEEAEAHDQGAPPAPAHQFHSRIASKGWTTAALPGQNAPVPQIIETPPPGEKRTANNYILPERSSSHQPPPPQLPTALAPGRNRAQRPPLTKQPSSTLDDIASHPTLLPGSGGTRTDALTLVPTFHDKKDKKDGGRKTSWGWLLGNEGEREREKEKDETKETQKERERQREKDERERDALRKPKISSKLAKAPEKARLDVLQTSIDGGGSTTSRGRESIVLDRESLKLEEERRKDSHLRKTGESGKKEKDGILSALFGGGKHRSKEDAAHKKRQHVDRRGLSPEPPARVLKPDIDYNWTRFSILEERAIYRMAHIKLANPRRALYSQVLLSNFMYSYLAKVQMMHPQIQIPAAQQKAQQQQRTSKAAQKPEDKLSEEFAQYQRWQEQQANEAAAGAAAPGAQQSHAASTSSDTTTLPLVSNNSRAIYQDLNQSPNQTPSQNTHQGPPAAAYGAVHGGTAAQGQAHDYLGYSTTQQPFEQTGFWGDGTQRTMGGSDALV